MSIVHTLEFQKEFDHNLSYSVTITREKQEDPTTGSALFLMFGQTGLLAKVYYNLSQLTSSARITYSNGIFSMPAQQGEITEVCWLSLYKKTYQIYNKTEETLPQIKITEGQWNNTDNIDGVSFFKRTANVVRADIDSSVKISRLQLQTDENTPLGGIQRILWVRADQYKYTDYKKPTSITNIDGFYSLYKDENGYYYPFRENTEATGVSFLVPVNAHYLVTENDDSDEYFTSFMSETAKTSDNEPSDVSNKEVANTDLAGTKFIEWKKYGIDKTLILPKYKKIEVEEENNDFYDVDEKVVRMYQDTENSENKSIILYENWSKFENELYGKDLSQYFYYIDNNIFKYYAGKGLYKYYHISDNSKIIIYRRTGKVKMCLPERLSYQRAGSGPIYIYPWDEKNSYSTLVTTVRKTDEYYSGLNNTPLLMAEEVYCGDSQLDLFTKTYIDFQTANYWRTVEYIDSNELYDFIRNVINLTTKVECCEIQNKTISWSEVLPNEIYYNNYNSSLSSIIGSVILKAGGQFLRGHHVKAEATWNEGTPVDLSVEYRINGNYQYLNNDIMPASTDTIYFYNNEISNQNGISHQATAYDEVFGDTWGIKNLHVSLTHCYAHIKKQIHLANGCIQGKQKKEEIFFPTIIQWDKWTGTTSASGKWAGLSKTAYVAQGSETELSSTSIQNFYQPYEEGEEKTFDELTTTTLHDQYKALVTQNGNGTTIGYNVTGCPEGYAVCVIPK